MKSKSIIKTGNQNITFDQNKDSGYINATQICKASNKNIADYLRLKETSEFLNVLSADMGIPTSELIEIYKGGNDKKNQGTWVHPQVAINLANWASPEFAVIVSKVVFNWMKTMTTTNLFLQNVLSEVPSKYKKTFDDDFFEALSRIYNWEYDKKTNTPSYFGKFINKYIYEYLWSGLPSELKKKRIEYAQKVESDEEIFRLHQFFQDNAKDQLNKHINQTIPLMRLAYNIDHFDDMFARSFRTNNQLLLNFAKN